MFLDLHQPVVDVQESLGFGDIIDHDNPLGPLVIGTGDGLEAFLPGGVPDLGLDGLAVEIEGPDLEVDSDGGEEVFVEDLVGEAEEETGLSDGGVAHQEELEQVVVLLIHGM